MDNKRILIFMVIIPSLLLIANQLGANNTWVFFVAQVPLLASALLWLFTPANCVAINNLADIGVDKSAENSEVDDKIIHSVIFELQQFLHQEIIIIENEVQRTALLVEEAFVGLAESLKSLQGLSNEQQQMIQLIMQSKNNVVNINEADSLFGFIEEVNLRLEKFVEIINSSKKNLEELSYTDEIANKLEYVIGLLAYIKSKKPIIIITIPIPIIIFHSIITSLSNCL